MKIKPGTSFPHPILGALSNDYLHGHFELNFEVEEDIAIDHLKLVGRMDIELGGLSELMGSGLKSGLMVVCGETYYDEFHETSVGPFELDLSGGKVRGNVGVRGIVATTQEVNLQRDRVIPWFKDESLRVGQGELVAVTQEVMFEAGYEKLASMESIFRLIPSDQLGEGQIDVQLDAEAIEIHAHPELFEMIANTRRISSIREFLVPSVYLPALIGVIDQVQQGAEQFSDRRWFSVLAAKLNAEGVDVESMEPLATAQRLLHFPVGRLGPMLARLSS